MENRAYARTGLTIRQLAEELKTPEHRLRALINSRLGYKNFSTFLNGYRIKEACDRLQDPKEFRIPVLTIALDAGFASLAPFNRAFRQAVDMTPTEFRRQKLQAENVVTAIRS
jgi:AraC-like DNA-binding protein